MIRECTVDGCGKPAKRERRLCSMHNARWERHGSTEARRGNTGTLLERYERFVVRGDDCWGWTGFSNERGYGHLDKRYAHRIAYELFVGPIPDGLFVLHRCDNPPCTRSDHLFLGTQADNAADAAAKGRTTAGERNAAAKLTAAAVAEIRQLCALGSAQRQVADRFGISQSQISSIVKRKSWASL